MKWYEIVTCIPVVAGAIWLLFKAKENQKYRNYNDSWKNRKK